MSYVLHLVTMTGLYCILTVATNLAVGYGGMIALCQAALLGVGAYTGTLLVMKTGLPHTIAFGGAALLTACVAYGIAAVGRHFRGDFFTLATIGFQTILYSVIYNWITLTSGPYGISGVPRPAPLAAHENELPAFALLYTIAATVTILIVRALVDSGFGRAVQAVRDDEAAAASLGKDVQSIRRQAMFISGAFTGLAGALFAIYVTYIDPTSFTVDESILIFSATVVGGLASLRGAVVGAVLLVVLPEVLRFVPLPDAFAANARQIVWGLLLIIMMRLRPQGIAGRYSLG